MKILFPFYSKFFKYFQKQSLPISFSSIFKRHYSYDENHACAVTQKLALSGFFWKNISQGRNQLVSDR